MSKKTRLLTDSIVEIQEQLNFAKDLARDLDAQLRECKAQLTATDEEARELMVENGKLRRANDKIIPLGLDKLNRDEMQAAFDREMGA